MKNFFVYTFLKKFLGGEFMITKETKISEVLEINEALAEILLDAGMHCLGCPSAAGESLEEACLVHGIDVDALVEELNQKNNSK